MPEPVLTDIKVTVTDYRARGRRGELLALLRSHVSAQPDDRVAIMELATELRAVGQREEALALLEPLANDAGFAGQLQSILEISSAFADAGDRDQADRILRQAQTAFPDNHWPVLLRASMLRSEGDAAAALAVIGEAYEQIELSGRAPLANFVAALTSNVDFSRARQSISWGAKSLSPQRFFEGAAMILLIKDEADIITQNLEHHYNMGFRVFCVIDNGSTDGSAELVRAFRTRRQDALVLYAFDPVTGHYQAAKMRMFHDLLLPYADIAGLKIDWIFYVDADEFLTYAGPEGEEGRIVDLLSRDRLALLAMMWVNCASEAPLAKLEEAHSPFQACPLAQGPMTDVATKIALRSTSPSYPMEGNHFAEPFPHGLDEMATLSSVDWYIYHFPLRSRDQVRRKVINGGKAFQDTSGLENHGSHWKQRYDLYLKEGENVIDQVLQHHIDTVRNSLQLG